MQNQFQFIKDIHVHHTVKMTSKDFIGFMLSQGALQEIIKLDHPLKEEITKLTELVEYRLGNKEYDTVFSYRLRVAKK